MGQIVNKVRRVMWRGMRVMGKEPRVVVRHNSSGMESDALCGGLQVSIVCDFTGACAPALHSLRHICSDRELGDHQEFFDRGGVIWAITTDDVPVGYGAAIQGRHLERWWWPLEPDDWVISRVNIVDGWRGKGIGPLAIKQVCRQITDSGQDVYADIKCSNQSSRKAFRKCGFEEVNVVRSLIHIAEQ